MQENVFYDEARNKITEYIKEQFPNFPAKLLAHFLNLFSSIGNYEEESTKIKPSILFTNNIETLVKNVPTAYRLPLFVDTNEALFNSRIKALAPFCLHDWCIYIDIKEEKFTYGIYKALNSIKEKDFDTLMFESQALKEKTDKVFAIRLRANSTYCINIKSLKDEEVNINFALSSKKILNWDEEIKEFVDASFSKLRTTAKKLSEIKTLYQNIFANVFKNVHGAICVVVDKEYIDNGFFEDGIWLKEPIEFSKLFTHGKNFSEEKLTNMAQLFIDMLNYDGITIVDNAGRIRAYNVFVETNLAKTSNILGGARKRAAFTIINSRRKRIVGVYFQSQDGDMFYQKVRQ